MKQSRDNVLRGWKEIAAHIARDVRTAERWEKRNGLPVRRVPGEGRSAVYALKTELDAWLSSRDVLETEDSAMPLTVGAPPIATRPPQEPTVSRVSRRSLIWTLASVVTLTVIVEMSFVKWHARDATPAGEPGPIPAERRSNGGFIQSTVPGVDELYLRGMYFDEQRTPESLDRALHAFLDAIAMDPYFAPGYSGLASTYDLLREYSTMPSAEAFPKARAAAERAIALDPALPEPHASLGFTLFFWYWDAGGAEREFRTALALDPNSARAHHWYGSMLLHQARYVKALAQLDMALRLQPASKSILTMHAFALGLSGHRDEADTILRAAVESDQRSPVGHDILAALSLVEPRDVGEYLHELEQVAELRHDAEDQSVLMEAERAYHASGERAAWQTLIDADRRLHPEPSHATFRMVDAEVALGHTDDAFVLLSQLVERHDPWVIGMAIDPLMTDLHQDPRFIKLAAAVGLPNGSLGSKSQ